MVHYRYKKFALEQIVITILLGLGIILPLIQFLYFRSLWHDEALLALNIIHKDYFELLKPLDYYQVAPIIFLMIEKFFSTLIPHSDYGLRLLPLLSYWASLFFFYQIIKKLFNNKITIILTFAFFVFNHYLIYYSNEVKQYMSDVMTYTAIAYFTLKNYQKERTKLYILGIIGTIAIFFSNVAPIILSSTGLYLLYEQYYLKKTKNIGSLAVLFMIWLSAFAVYFYFFVFNHPSQELMDRWWSDVLAFLPLNSWRDFFRFVIYAPRVFLMVLSYPIIFRVIIIIPLIIGIYSIIRGKQIGIAIFTFTPIILHLILSTFHLYPVSQRLILYLTPSMLLICAAGFNYMLTWLSFRFKSLNYNFLCFIPILFLFFFHDFPIRPTPSKSFFNIKKSMKYLERNVSNDETIYVYWLAGPSFKYYQDIGLTDIHAHVIISRGALFFSLAQQKSGDTFNDLEALYKTHGKVWLYFDGNYLNQKDDIINHIDSMGYGKIKEYNSGISSIFLYDFK